MSGLVYKRPDSPVWYVSKTRQSTKTTNRKLAEEFARKALTELWRDEVLEERVRTWVDLCADWEDRNLDTKRSFDQDARVIRQTTEFLRRRDLLDKSLATIDADTLREYAKQVKRRASGATANRHLTIIRSMLRRAHDAEWISRVPKLEMYHEPRPEPRWLSRAEFAALISHLPPWAADLAIVAVQTGLRFSNVAGLRWDWLDDALTICTVPAGYTKTDRTYTAPVSSVAREVLERRRKDGAAVVFPEATHMRFYRAWQAAVTAAGIARCRPHDLRHTWASWHLQAGTPDRIIQESAGWTSNAMLQRYGHLKTSHLVDYADNLNKDTK